MAVPGSEELKGELSWEEEKWVRTADRQDRQRKEEKPGCKVSIRLTRCKVETQ